MLLLKGQKDEGPIFRVPTWSERLKPTYNPEVWLPPVLLEGPLRPLFGQVVHTAAVEDFPESGQKGRSDVAARLRVHQCDEYGPRRHGGLREARSLRTNALFTSHTTDNLDCFTF